MEIQEGTHRIARTASAVDVLKMIFTWGGGAYVSCDLSG